MTMEYENLPALLTRAGNRLIEARTSGELLEAKRLAEAALHYAKVTKAANDTHADCLRIIARAEIRMANEIDRGQATGEVATVKEHPHGLVRTPDKPPATFADLGISRQRVAEFRQVRDAGEAAVEAAIADDISRGVTPTKTSIQNHIRGTFGTGENEWYTPAEYIEAARTVLGTIDLDPASSAQAQRVVRADKYFTREDDGLAHPWHGRVWLNPPYAQPLMSSFVSKMIAELKAGNVISAIMLTHKATLKRWLSHHIVYSGMALMEIGSRQLLKK
jgi:hypothetical protein